ncbi:MAG: ribosome biogenesis GTP-binding protein YsxC [Polyangiaceae bacterium]|nr:ribosome biogenesis GTP-binding protein YsxC [Polyangiaceae bacterium]
MPAPLPAIRSAAFVAGATLPAQLPPPTLAEIAFAGRSNVGKSSLMNALLGRKNLVRTSSTPGCTRQLSFFEVRAADDLGLYLVDLPGYGWAQRSKEERAQWAELVESYLLERPTLAAVCVLVDSRRGVEEEERLLFELLADTSRAQRRPPAVLLVATKLDHQPRSRAAAVVATLARDAGRPVLGCSAVNGAGVPELWRALRAAVARR